MDRRGSGNALWECEAGGGGSEDEEVDEDSAVAVVLSAKLAESLGVHVEVRGVDREVRA